MNRLFYKPNYTILIIDFIVLLINFLFLGTCLNQISTFIFICNGVYFLFALLWFVFNYLFKRYNPVRNEKGYLVLSFRLLYTTILSSFLCAFLFYFFEISFPILNFLKFSLGVFLGSFVCTTLRFAYVYALDIEDVAPIEDRLPAKLVKKSYELDDETYNAIQKSIIHESGTKELLYLEKITSLRSSTTRLLSTTSIFNFEQLRDYGHDVIINLKRLNDIRGINVLFSKINEKLPDNGIFIGCFQNNTVKKREILNKYPKGINWIFYVFYYFIKRVIPNVFLTRRLYYDITNGKNRELSKAEVYGRLYYCGFEIVTEKKINGLTYFKARRKKTPNPRKKRRYGPIIQLKRVGKNGRVFKFYKMRTMHPYSEFLQEYIYEKNRLQEGGKFNHDIRITTLGRLFRRFWLDELPMFLNFFKGDMKFVGVRPISKQYFNLYNKELQEKRTNFKPGLFPPFYADMPKTLEEIQKSEMKYLCMCEQKGELLTDIIYLYKIIINILFKKARSK